MAILLAFLFGAVGGVIAHVALPGRERRGVLLLPVLGTLLGGAVWMLCTWLGMGADNPWLWLLSIVVPVVGVVPTGVVLARARAAHDAREKVRLKLV